MREPAHEWQDVLEVLHLLLAQREFERADVVAPFSFSEFGRSGPLNREGDFVQLPYSTRNPIEYTIPTLFLQDGGLLDVPQEDSLMKTGDGPLARMMNIWSTESIHRSLSENNCEVS